MAEARTEATEVEYASRLTIKDLGCDSKLVLKLPEGQNKIAIARMYGIVSKVTTQEDRTGSGQIYTQFIGDFEGINLQDGTTLQSGKMYLPEGASQILEHKINAVQSSKGKQAMVNFAFEIRVVKTTENRMGYKYETGAILQPGEVDHMAKVREVVAAAPKPKIVEVPKPEAKPDAKEGKEPAKKTA